MNLKIISKNRKAYFNYHILKKFESGVVLLGSEVKAIREGKINIKESYIRFIKNELFAIGMNISEYSNSGYTSHDPQRVKKLLLNGKELEEIQVLTQQKGNTIVPISVYFKRGKVKVEFGVAKGKKLWDKRKDKQDMDVKRDIDRKLKERL
ncbi:MAG: SsrA-binding protein [Candidatus Marinimicrobia bacterium]|nr:SsrA-binding protein [Candidatus Neomarinimicrobiota bacterium]|tara:strand:+ start:7932 stop:8384 length:453 start_codon:yes stop_codon:yes gene_type:complete